MKKEDVIRMAKEAKLNIGPAGMGQTVWGGDAELERFAALVAAAEREACAKLVDHILKEGGGTYGDAIRARSQA
jgi:hypothetical protein